MPYIAIKAMPTDDAVKKAAVEKINAAVLEAWGCPPQGVTISFEEFTPEEWPEKVAKPEIEAKPDKMLILWGEKKI